MQHNPKKYKDSYCQATQVNNTNDRSIASKRFRDMEVQTDDSIPLQTQRIQQWDQQCQTDLWLNVPTFTVVDITPPSGQFITPIISEQLPGLLDIYPGMITIVQCQQSYQIIDVKIKSIFNSNRDQHELLIRINMNTQDLQVSYDPQTFTKSEEELMQPILRQFGIDLNMFNLILSMELLVEHIDGSIQQSRMMNQIQLPSTTHPPLSVASSANVKWSIQSQSKGNYQDFKDNLMQKYDAVPLYKEVPLIKPVEFQQKPLMSCNFSRFVQDFENIKKIGAGGFGQVYSATNRLDGNEYAIKRLLLDYSSDKYCQKTKNEAVLLSRIQHPYIVRYYQAWTEGIDSQNQSEDSGYDEEEQSEESSDVDAVAIVQKDFTNHELEDDEEYEYYEEEVDNYENMQINWLGEEQDVSETAKSISRKPHRQSTKEKKQNQYLFIQMEYCSGETLKSKIDDKSLNSEQKKTIIRQILEALNYLHNKKYIHRDLKPSNIFLDENLNVKLGDFGLATEMKAEIEFEKGNQLSRAQSIVDDGNKSDMLTKGVGTYLYLAPEQRDSNKYDAKVDMYSLGIILFELYYAFKTDHQKINCLDQLKYGILPQDFDQCVGLEDIDIREKIKKLVDQNPKNRLDSKYLLEEYSDKKIQQIIRSIANPNHYEYRSIIQVLFECKSLNPLAEFSTSYFEKALNKRSDIFLKDYNRSLNCLKDRIELIFRLRGAIQFDISPIIPALKTIKMESVKGIIVEYDNYRLCSQQYLCEDGSLVQYSDNLIMPLIYMLPRIPLKNFRKYSFNEVQSVQQTLSKQKCASYNIISEQYQREHIIELLSVGVDILKQFTHHHSFEIRISHTQLFELMLIELGYDHITLIRMQSNQQLYSNLIEYSNTKSNTLKQQIQQDIISEFGMSIDRIHKFLNFLSLKQEFAIFAKQSHDDKQQLARKKFTDLVFDFFTNVSDPLISILREIDQLIDSITGMPFLEGFHITYEVLQDNQLLQYFSGITFELVETQMDAPNKEDHVDKKSQSDTKQTPLSRKSLVKYKSIKNVYIVGGKYSHYLQNKSGCGMQVYYDHLHYSKFMKFIRNHETEFEPLLPSRLNYIRPNEVDVLIYSDGPMQLETFRTAQRFWEKRIAATIIQISDKQLKETYRRQWEICLSQRPDNKLKGKVKSRGNKKFKSEEDIEKIVEEIIEIKKHSDERTQEKKNTIKN